MMKEAIAMNQPAPKIYRINVAMAQLGVSRTTIYRLVKAGDLDLVKVSVRASGITADSITRHLSKKAN
jgi:predicted DNA-binding transcriptional regulator AlpA